MEDFDLNELDQAVTKIMSKPKRKARKKESPAPVVNAAPEPPVVVQPAPTPEEPKLIVPADHGDRISVSRPMPKVPERRRMHPGAMDIIQPQMPKMGAPSSRPNRSAASLEPTQSVKPEPVMAKPAPVEEDVSEEVLAALNMSESSTKQVESPAPKSHDTWPDPLDFHDMAEPQKLEEPELPKEEAPTMEPKKESLPDPDALLDDSTNATPFITTKVEKRPLGAYADAVPAEPETPKPTQDEPTRAEMAEGALQSAHHLSDDDDSRPTNITPQYHTAAIKPSEDVHNMFDTKEYHAAPQMVHPAKRGGSPWFVIGVVVLVLLIVAAIGVGIFMMTGTLDLTKLW